MRTKEEIEAAISEEISRFEQDYMGRGPKDIQVHLIDDMLLIRLRGVLAAAEHALGQIASGRKRAGFAQASAVPSDRNDPSNHGGDGREGHRRQGRDHAP